MCCSDGITWNTSETTGDWIDISPSDGENVTGLKRFQKALLVFKNNHIYRVYDINTSEPDPQIQVGTYSHRSIVPAKNGSYFHHPSGFYKYADGGVQEISKPIQDIVDNIALSNYDDICGWTDGDHVSWSVGNVTIDGVTVNNVVVRYTISSRTWTRLNYSNQILVASPYNDGTTLFRLVGGSNGDVLKVDTGLKDNGTAISYNLTHRWYTVDGQINTRKHIQRLAFEHDGGTGTNLSVQTENDPAHVWNPIGQLKQTDTELTTDIRARRCRFRLTGTSSGESFTYRGFEITDASSEPVRF